MSSKLPFTLDSFSKGGAEISFLFVLKTRQEEKIIKAAVPNSILLFVSVAEWLQELSKWFSLVRMKDTTGLDCEVLASI